MRVRLPPSPPRGIMKKEYSYWVYESSTAAKFGRASSKEEALTLVKEILKRNFIETKEEDTVLFYNKDYHNVVAVVTKYRHID